MTAPLLLEVLRERGARVSLVERDGSAVLLVAPRGIVGDLAGDVARFKPSLVELLQAEQQLLDGADDEAPLELLRLLRNAGVSVQLRDVAHASDETDEVTADGPPLVWNLPQNWSDTLKRDTAARLEQYSEAITQRLEFERWHWRACAKHFGDGGQRLSDAPASVPYSTWSQFTRFQVGTQTEGDLHDLARFIQSEQHECERRAFYERVKVAWRVVAALSDREPTLGDIARWAEMVLSVEVTA